MPFLTFITPTFRRPQGLAACLESVRTQTAVRDVEHVVLVDHVGRGIGAMFARLPGYTDAVHGEYVHVLSDDETLAGPDVVDRLRAFVRAHGNPPAVTVRGYVDQIGPLPDGPADPPVVTKIGLMCLVTRADVWRATTLAGGYGPCYEGDYMFAKAVWDAGHKWLACDVEFSRGASHQGLPEFMYA